MVTRAPFGRSAQYSLVLRVCPWGTFIRSFESHAHPCYGVEVFRRFFEQIVEQCQQAGLIRGKELYINATKMEANASLASLKPRFAVEALLESLFGDAQESAEHTEQESLSPVRFSYKHVIRFLT